MGSDLMEWLQTEATEPAGRVGAANLTPEDQSSRKRPRPAVKETTGLIGKGYFDWWTGFAVSMMFASKPRGFFNFFYFLSKSQSSVVVPEIGFDHMMTFRGPFSHFTFTYYFISNQFIFVVIVVSWLSKTFYLPFCF